MLLEKYSGIYNSMSDPGQKIKSLAIRLRIAQREAKKKALKELALIMPDVLKLRIQQEGEGLKGKLPPLTSDAYIKLRKKSKRLSPDTSPTKSNLTATGQMLEAIKTKITGDKLTIFINNNKRKADLSGRKSDLTNNELRKIIEDEVGTKFFDLTKEEREEATELATKIIADEIKSQLG